MSKNRLPCVSVLVRDIKNVCANVVVSGALINWDTSSRYLGVYLESCSKLKCSFASNKSNASEEVLFALIKSKCLPILLYDVEECPTNSADKQSLQVTMNRVLFKIFTVSSKKGLTLVVPFFHQGFQLYFVNFDCAIVKHITRRCVLQPSTILRCRPNINVIVNQ